MLSPLETLWSSSLFESSEAKELLLQGGEYSTSYSNATAMVLCMHFAFLLSLSRAFRASFSIKYCSKFCDKRYGMVPNNTFISMKLKRFGKDKQKMKER